METALVSYDNLYIGSRWSGSDPDRKPVVVTNPATEAVFATVTTATIADADAAVDAARALHVSGDWARRSFADRADVLDRIADAIEARGEEFARAYVEDFGGLAAFGTHLATRAAGLFRNNARIARQIPDAAQERSGSGAKVYVARLPVGPVLGVVPWNAPLVLATVKAAAALAAGCPVILRMDIETPIASFIMSEAFASVDLPEGLISVLPADVEVTKYLVAHPGIAHVSFTGSTAVGKDVMRSAADNLTRITLELGGKSAAIVLDDVEPSSATIVYTGCLLQSGQVCTTFSRILVPRSTSKQWTQALGEFFGSLRVGDPDDSATQIGPLVSERHRASVERYIALAREEGTIVTGGNRPPSLSTGYYIEPTLVTDVELDSRIAQEEVFGPVIVLQVYDDVDDAVRIANGTSFGLAAGIYTEDIERGIALAARVEAGTVSINNFGANLEEPFGGFKQSGIGREGGLEGIEEFLEIKQIQLPSIS